MSIARFYEPSFSFSEVDDLIDQAFKAQGNWHNVAAALEKLDENRVLKPRMDLHENPEANTVTATFELPGLSKDKIAIDVHNNRLTVSGQIYEEAAGKSQDGYVIKERWAGKFTRSLVLPERTPPEAIKTSMENGLLTVTFPKSSPGQEPQRITIS